MSVPASQTLTVGKSSSAASAYHEGYIDQFIFQNTTTAWTKQQVEDLYTKGVIPLGVNVLYDMEDSVNDTSGNNNHGTLSNGAYSLITPTTVRTATPQQRSNAASTRNSFSSRQTLTGNTRFDKLRGWNYSSNYLNGSSTNPWYIETKQVAYDLEDIAAAGMNVVKIYADENNAASHLAALDQVAAAGLKAIVLRFITYNTDYSLATGSANRTAAIAKYTGMIGNLKDHPAIIGWGFGNENNLSGNRTDGTTKYEWFTLLEEAIQAGKAIDSTRFHFTANAEVSDVASFDTIVPSIDIWGLNVYRGTAFSGLLSAIQLATDKPVILTEFGRKRPDNTTTSQQTQADEVISLIREAENAFPLIRGWVHFKFTHTRVTDTGDEFWEASLPLTQGTYQSRTKMLLYDAMKNHCTNYKYGQGAV